MHCLLHRIVGVLLTSPGMLCVWLVDLVGQVGPAAIDVIKTFMINYIHMYIRAYSFAIIIGSGVAALRANNELG